MFNSLIAFLSWNACTFSILKDFSVENLETTPSTFLSKFSSGIYSSQIINNWGSIFYILPNVRSVQFDLFYPYFFSFFLSFLFYFSIGIFLDRH